MPYLIAVTPRAGKWNHRTLVANNWHEDVLELDQLVQMARQQLRGAAWLAVKHSVKQVNSEREGDELLILGDVAVEKLSPEAIDDITAKLTRCLEGDLTQLITATIDWTQEGKSDPIKRSELTDCYHHLFTELALPPATDNLLWNESCARRDMSKKKEKIKNKQNKKIIPAVAGAVVLAVALAVSAETFLRSLLSSKNTLSDSVCKLSDKYSGEDCKEKHNTLCVILASKPGEECNKELQTAYFSTDFETNVVNHFLTDNQTISLSDVANDEIQREITNTPDKQRNPPSTKITPQQYKLIREYQAKIRSAWQALVAFDNDKFESKIPNYSSSIWGFDAYDVALQEINVFLDENEIKTEYISVKFNPCQKTGNTITQRINNGCQNNGQLAEILKLIAQPAPKPELKVIEVIKFYKAIFELKAPTINSKR